MKKKKTVRSFNYSLVIIPHLFDYHGKAARSVLRNIILLFYFHNLQAALEVGLHVGRVKMALKRRMEQTGVPYADADQLIEDVLHQQFREDDSRYTI